MPVGWQLRLSQLINGANLIRTNHLINLIQLKDISRFHQQIDQLYPFMKTY